MRGKQNPNDPLQNMNETLKIKLSRLPTCPGCYLMKSEGTISPPL